MSKSRLSTTACDASRLINSSSRVFRAPEERFQSESAWETDFLMTRLLGRIRGDEEVDPGELRPLRADRRELDGGDEVWLRRKGDILEVDADADVEVDVEERKDELLALAAPESSGGGGGWGLCLLGSFLRKRAGVVMGVWFSMGAWGWVGDEGGHEGPPSDL
jgi:hypothetical protein